MPDKKITELSAIVTIANNDVLPIVDISENITKKIDIAQLKAQSPVQSVNAKVGIVVLNKGDIGLSEVDNTSDANKPISTATQTALDAKQNTLVSGTTIKTINSSSILGSGNISVAPATGIDATAISTGVVSNAEFNYLDGVTSGIQAQLDNKVDENAAILAATKTKITYDTKGLVTSGADATTADIADSTNKRYVTDANLTTIANTSGTNTGDNAVNSLYSGLAASKQDTLTLTTTGTSGAATLIGATLNIPQYSGGGGGTTWGSITGTLSSQTDLQTALDAKVDENAAIVAATKTKITYDAKGLVTAGADATTADIAASTNKNYVTDAQATVIGNTSGTNSGNQTLANTSDATSHTVTLSSTGGSVQLVEGSGITLTTTGTSSDGIITIASTGGGSGTVTNVSALTLGTTGTDLSSTVANSTTTPVITLNVPNASAANRGALTSTDWSTFNGKQDALVSGTNIKTINSTSILGSGNLVVSATASGVSGAIQFSDGSGLTSDAANFFYDNTNDRLGIGINAPTARLHIKGSGATSATSSLKIVNSASTDILTITDDGISAFNNKINVVQSSVAVTSMVTAISTGSFIGGKLGSGQEVGVLVGGESNGFGYLQGRYVNTPEQLRMQLFGNGVSIGSSSGTGWLSVGSLNQVALSRLGVPIAPTASSQYGLVSLGSGAFNGSTSGFFTGAATGTLIAGNLASGATSDLLNLQVAGVDKFKVNSSGNLGIGITTPTSRLHIKGSGTTSATTSLSIVNSSNADLLTLTDDSYLRIGATGTLIRGDGAVRHTNNIGVNTQGLYLSCSTVNADALITYVGGQALSNITNYWNGGGNIGVIGKLRVGATSGANTVATFNSHLAIETLPTASANYGSIALGLNTAFDGVTSGKFVGSSNGTYIAINKTSGSSNYLDFQNNGVSLFKIDNVGKPSYESTVTPSGTTGNQTINKPSGTVNIAAAGTTITVTNSLVTTSSIVMAVIRTNDATAYIKNVVPNAGSFDINLGAAATAEISIGFIVNN